MKALKVSIVAFFIILLSACSTQKVITRTEYVAPTVNYSLYQCPVVKKFPNYNTLTDGQVAELLVKLQTNNVNCADALEALKKHIRETERIINEQGK